MLPLTEQETICAAYAASGMQTQVIVRLVFGRACCLRYDRLVFTFHKFSCIPAGSGNLDLPVVPVRMHGQTQDFNVFMNGVIDHMMHVDLIL